MKQPQNQIILICIVFLLVMGIFFTSSLVQQSQDTRSSAASVPKCLTYSCQGQGVKSEATYSCDQLYGKEAGCNSNPECKWADGACTGVAHRFYGCNVASDEYQCNNLNQQTGEPVTGSCAWTCAVYETPTLPPLSKDEVLNQKIKAELGQIQEYLEDAERRGDRDAIKLHNTRIKILEKGVNGTSDDQENARSLLDQIDRERDYNTTLRTAKMNENIVSYLGSSSACLPGNNPCIAGENAYQNCKNQTGCTEDQAINARDEAYNEVMGDATKRANRGDQKAKELVDKYNALEAEQRRLAEEKNAQEEAAKKKATTTPIKTATILTQKPKTPEEIAKEKIELAANKKLFNENDPAYLDNLMKLVRGQIVLGDVTFSLYPYDTNVLDAYYTTPDGETHHRQFYFDPNYGPAPWQFYVYQYENITNRNMRDIDAEKWTSPTTTPKVYTREELIVLGSLTVTPATIAPEQDSIDDSFKFLNNTASITDIPPTSTPPFYNSSPTGTLPPQGKVPYAYNPPPPTEITPWYGGGLPGSAPTSTFAPRPLDGNSTSTPTQPKDTPAAGYNPSGAPGVNGPYVTSSVTSGPQPQGDFHPLDTDSLITDWSQKDVRAVTPTPLDVPKTVFDTAIDTTIFSSFGPFKPNTAIVFGLDMLGIDIRPSSVLNNLPNLNANTGEGTGIGIGPKFSGSTPYIPPLFEAVQNFDLGKNLDQTFTQLGNNLSDFFGGKTPYTGPTFEEIPVTKAPAPTAPLVEALKPRVTATETPSASQIKDNQGVNSLTDTYINNTYSSVTPNPRPTNVVVPTAPVSLPTGPTGTPSADEIRRRLAQQQNTSSQVTSTPSESGGAKTQQEVKTSDGSSKPSIAFETGTPVPQKTVTPKAEVNAGVTMTPRKLAVTTPKPLVNLVVETVVDLGVGVFNFILGR